MPRCAPLCGQACSAGVSRSSVEQPLPVGCSTPLTSSSTDTSIAARAEHCKVASEAEQPHLSNSMPPSPSGPDPPMHTVLHLSSAKARAPLTCSTGSTCTGVLRRPSELAA